MSPRDVQSTFLGRTQFMFYQGRLMSSHNVLRKIVGRTQIVFYRRRLNMSPRTILRQILGRTQIVHLKKNNIDSKYAYILNNNYQNNFKLVIP